MKVEVTDAERSFPIMIPYRHFGTIRGPCSIPWRIVAPFEHRAKSNHGGQSLARLAGRGGLSPNELLCIITDRPLFPTSEWPDEQAALNEIVEIVRRHEG